MFALLVTFEVLPDRLTAFDDLVGRTLAEIAAHEPGTLVYLTHTNAGRPYERIFYECYADRESFDAHEATAHTKAFLAARAEYLAAEPEVRWLSAEAGAVGGRLVSPPTAPADRTAD